MKRFSVLFFLFCAFAVAAPSQACGMYKHNKNTGPQAVIKWILWKDGLKISYSPPMPRSEAEELFRKYRPLDAQMQARISVFGVYPEGTEEYGEGYANFQEVLK